LSEISCWEIITPRRLFYWLDHTDPSMFDLIHIILLIRINQSFIINYTLRNMKVKSTCNHWRTWRKIWFSTLELTYGIKNVDNKNIINDLFCHSSREFWIEFCENIKNVQRVKFKRDYEKNL
jgi:hypothetical protein